MPDLFIDFVIEREVVEIKSRSPTLRFASVLTHSDNRRICGSLTLAQISQSETSHIPKTLSEMLLEVAEDERSEEAI